MTNGFWNGRTVLLTGATGLVGGWLLKRLLNEGAEVIVFLRDCSPGSMAVRENLLERCVVVKGALTDATTLRRALMDHCPKTVFHLAAQTQVGIAKVDPVGTFEANIRGSWTLLEACRECNVPQVVLSSSDKAYGSSTNLPYLETHPLQGRFPYEVSKSCVDLIAQMYAFTFGMQVCIVRCANLFGGGDMNFNRTVPGLIRETIHNRRFIIRSDGKFIRDFLYVEDAVDAYMRVAECLAHNPSLAGEAFNFSLEVRLSVLHVVDCVLRIMGREDLSPIVQNATFNEIREQYMLSSKAKEHLLWSPSYCMEEGLVRTVNWYLDHLHTCEPATHELQAIAGR